MSAVRQIVAKTALRSSQRVAPAVLLRNARCIQRSSLPSLPSYAPSPRWSPLNGFHSTTLQLSQETSWADKGKINYKELKSIAEQPTGEVTIIDVREPDEVSAGMIPSAVNVPLTQFEKAFSPNKGADFQEKFAFPRPGFNDKLVFYCRSGKRSDQALQIVKKNGWKK